MIGEKRPSQDTAFKAAKKQRVEETEPVPTTPNHWPDTRCFEDTIEVIVGSGITERTHVVHKGLLCFYSEYFRASLNGGFREAYEGKVELDDLDPKIFAMFNGWLYTRKLCSKYDATDSSHDEMPNLCKLFVFGDKHILPLLKNDVINAIIELERHPKYLSKEFCRDIEYAYHSTPSGSPLRRILIDSYASYCCMDGIIMNPNRDLRDTDPEAVWDFAMAVMDIAKGTPRMRKMPSLIAACEYHDHPKGIKCPKT